MVMKHLYAAALHLHASHAMQARYTLIVQGSYSSSLAEGAHVSDVPSQTFTCLLRRASRAPTEASFEGAWEVLLGALLDVGVSDDAVREYLTNTIYRIRQRWAFCYRLGVLTLGINSTQRCEGYFGKLKAELVKVTTICHLKHTLGNITGRYDFAYNEDLSNLQQQLTIPHCR
jgi:hypothetical protein